MTSCRTSSPGDRHRTTHSLRVAGPAAETSASRWRSVPSPAPSPTLPARVSGSTCSRSGRSRVVDSRLRRGATWAPVCFSTWSSRSSSAARHGRRPAPTSAPALSWSTLCSAGSEAAFAAGASRRVSCSERAMRTEHWVAFVAAGLVCASPLAGQDALNRVGPKTQVSSVDFQFEDKSSLEEDQLRSKIALTGQGSMVGLRRTLGFLPFVPPVGAHPFDPLEMGRDVVRLRHYYQRSGFPMADVDYQAKYQAKSDQVLVTYRIAEGPPLMVDSLSFGGMDTALTLPTGLERNWQEFARKQ